MKTLEFHIEISAAKEKIWKILWDDANYPKWTSAFCQDSYALSDWKQSSKIHFLAADGQGINSCIYSKIPYEYMAFKHLGEIKDFKELPFTETDPSWSGAMETYRLIPTVNSILLEVKIDCDPKYQSYFTESFPKAMSLIKELSEN